MRLSLRRFLTELFKLLLAALAGLFIYASYEPLGWWWSAIVGLALWYLLLSGASLTRGALYTVACWAVCYLFLLPWVGEFVGAAPFLALCVYLSLWSVPLGVLGAASKRCVGWKSPFTLTAAFLALEWARSSFPFGGFSWVRLAWGQINGPLAPLVSLGGPALVTGATVSVSLLLAEFTSSAIPLLHRFSSFTKRRRAPLVASCILLLAGVLVGVFPHSNPVGEITVAAVQGNVPRMGLDFNSQQRAVLRNHVQETKTVTEPVDVIIWPENSADVNPMTDVTAGAMLTEALNYAQVPIVVGTITRDAAGEHNTMAVFHPDGTVGDMHHKKYLQPFGEYMPMRDFFRRLSPLADEAGDFKPGTDNGVVRVANTLLGVSTCYEVAFDAAGRDAVRAGATVMVTPTNNATFGFTDMTYQQLAMSRMRALELDRAVVVAATSGVSAIISPDGTIRSQTEIFTADHLRATVPLRNSVTLSARWGDWIEWVMVMIGVICSFHALRQCRRDLFTTPAQGFSPKGAVLGPQERRFRQPHAGKGDKPHYV